MLINQYVLSNIHIELYNYFSFNKFLLRKNGAISGPVAPINIEDRPLMVPTFMKDPDFLFFFEFLIKIYQIIKIPIRGFKKSTLISLADLTSKYWIKKIIINYNFILLVNFQNGNVCSFWKVL